MHDPSKGSFWQPVISIESTEILPRSFQSRGGEVSAYRGSLFKAETDESLGFKLTCVVLHFSTDKFRFDVNGTFVLANDLTSSTSTKFV